MPLRTLALWFAGSMIVHAAVQLGSVHQFGGSGTETVAAMARDGAGNLYIAGTTYSADFALPPGTAPGQAPPVNQPSDAYLLKTDASGKQVWAIRLGGSQSDTAVSLAVDHLGNIYVAGTTSSPDFPVTLGAITLSSGAGNFVTKVSADGRVSYSDTFADGGVVSAIAVDTAGNAYLAGIITEYISGGFFSIPEPYASVCKLNQAGTHLNYCVKLGEGHGDAIAADSDGNAYVGGDAGIWKVDAAGSVVYQASIKGTVRALLRDSQGSLYAGGNTTSTDFSTTPGAFQQQFNAANTQIAGALVAYSNDHGFVMRLSADSGAVLASTLLEGENWDHVLALSIDGTGNLIAGGVTTSNSFPLLGAFQMRFGYYTGFVAELTGDLTTLLFSTYVGDSGNFQVSGVTVADDGSIDFAGDTSNESGFFSGTNVLAPTSDIFLVNLPLVPSKPPVIQGVVNTASQAGTRIAPNQSITVVAPGAAADATVLLDGAPLPALSQSPGRIVAQIPLDYPVSDAGQLQLQADGSISDPLLIAGATASPAIYTKDGSGHGEALVFHEDGTLNSPDNPAAPGSIIAIACNGVGKIHFDGDYAVAEAPVSVYVDGFYANGVDAHIMQIPGIPGDTYVIRVHVPDPQIPNFKMPALVSLTLNIGGTSNASGILSQADVAISIKQ